MVGQGFCLSYNNNNYNYQGMKNAPCSLCCSVSGVSSYTFTSFSMDFPWTNKEPRPFETPLPINTEPKRLALGSDFTIGVKEDGTVWSWGRGGGAVLGTGGFKSQ